MKFGGRFLMDLRKMKGIYLILLVLSVRLSAQSLEEKVANELCICLKDEKVEEIEQLEQKLEPCMTLMVQKYFKDIYKMNTREHEELWNSVIILLIKNCSNFRNLALSSDNRPKIEEKSVVSDCEDLKIGSYFYEVYEKNYLIFTKNQVIENRAGGIYSISKIDWLDKCIYKLTLQETNSRFETVHMKENPYIFKIIENNKDYFVVQTQYIEGAGVNNVKIYKLPYSKGFSEDE